MRRKGETGFSSGLDLIHWGELGPPEQVGLRDLEEPLE